jgi:predicted transcriptional regulator
MSDHVKKQAALVKQLREEKRKTEARMRALLFEPKRIQKQICQAIREQPRTVPEVAQATGLPAHEVLWHITALRKYGEVVETGMSGAYYLYQTTPKATT